MKADTWDVAEPGSAEIDLVNHSGPSATGEFGHTPNLTDIFLGWCESRAVLGAGQEGVVAALEAMRRNLPFPLRAVDSDNGSEFINHHLVDYCRQRKVKFTRSRPYKKDDNAHIEQKNKKSNVLTIHPSVRSTNVLPDPAKPARSTSASPSSNPRCTACPRRCGRSGKHFGSLIRCNSRRLSVTSSGEENWDPPRRASRLSPHPAVGGCLLARRSLYEGGSQIFHHPAEARLCRSGCPSAIHPRDKRSRPA